MNKMKTVDLGTLDWSKYGVDPYALFYATVPDGRTRVEIGGRQAISIDGYDCKQTALNGSAAIYLPTKTACWDATNSQILIRDTAFTNPDSFKAAKSGVTLTYETVDTVEECIVSYHLPQLVNGSMNEDYAIITGQRVIIPKTDSVIAGTSVNKLTVPVPAGHKVLSFAKFIRGNAGTKYISVGGYHFEATTKSWQAALVIPNNQDLSGQTVSVFRTVTAPITDMWIFTRWSGDIVTEEIEFIWTFVDLTQLYGAGNEPTWLEKFLSDHPEYNNDVPFYDGPTLLEEVIL